MPLHCRKYPAHKHTITEANPRCIFFLDLSHIEYHYKNLITSNNQVIVVVCTIEKHFLTILN